MRNPILAAFTIFLLASCSAPTNLYTWNKYESNSYSYLKNTNEKTSTKLSEEYQKIIKKQKGTRGVVPPGIYADYGFLLLQANDVQNAKAMFQKEMDLYPESKLFIGRIIKMTE
jgi:hypothetical protein